MDYIKVRRHQTEPSDGLVIDIRRDLPFHAALGAALASFETAYLAALLHRHADLHAASRDSGLATADLVAMIERLAA